MAIRFELGPGDHRCTVHCTGTITLEDLQRAVDLQIAAGTWQRHVLYDTTEATGCVLHFDALQELVRYVERAIVGLPPRGRMAILAPNEMIYGCGRMYQASADGRLPMKVHVVRTREEAEAWLQAGESLSEPQG